MEVPLGPKNVIIYGDLDILGIVKISKKNSVELKK